MLARHVESMIHCGCKCIKIEKILFPLLLLQCFTTVSTHPLHSNRQACTTVGTDVDILF